MKLSQIYRIALTCTILLCAGWQNVSAGDLLSRKDSLALAQLMENYLDEKEKVYDKQTQELEALIESKAEIGDSIFTIRYEEASARHSKESEKMRKDFMQKLANNPQFAPVIKLHDLLENYTAEYQKAYHQLELENEKEENTFEDLNDFHIFQEMPFEYEWDRKFIELVRANPNLLELPEELIAETINPNMTICTSDDGCLRYYSWPTSHGGTMIDIASFRQFRTPDGQVLVSWESDSDNETEADDDWEWKTLVQDIYTIQIGGKKVYLLEKWSNSSSKFASYQYTADSIDNNTISHPKIFFDGENFTQNFTVDYDRFFQWDLQEQGIDYWIVSFDPDNQTIYSRIPILDENGDTINSEDYLSYPFNGQYYDVSEYSEIAIW